MYMYLYQVLYSTFTVGTSLKATGMIREGNTEQRDEASPRAAAARNCTRMRSDNNCCATLGRSDTFQKI